MVKNFTNIYLFTALAICLVVVLYYLQTGLLDGFEEKTFALRLRTLHLPSAETSSSAIIAIVDKKNAAAGRFPFSRKNDAHAAVATSAVLDRVDALMASKPFGEIVAKGTEKSLEVFARKSVCSEQTGAAL